MRHLLLGALGVVVLGACATSRPPPPTGGPRGLYASDHLEAARRHDDDARPGAGADLPGAGAGDPSRGIWYRSWDTAEHERAAEIHRSRAAELEADYEDWCAGFTPAEIRRSPLQEFGIGTWNTATGVIVYLASGAGEPDRLLLRMKCHRAWMRLAPAGMEGCPLDLPDLAIDARGDAGQVTVALSVPARWVAELQRRAALDLEGRPREAVPAP